MKWNAVYNWGYVSGACIRCILNCKCIDFFAVQHILMIIYGSLTIYFVIKYYERWEINHIKGIG